jgi:signal transduction histidine kinase
MTGYEILGAASVVLYTFGALAFTALTILYIAERRWIRGGMLAAFTTVCAAAFLLNLARAFDGPFWVGAAQEGLTAILPAILLQLIRAEEKCDRRWEWAIAAVFAAGLFFGPAATYTDRFDGARPILLAVVGVLGLAMLGTSRGGPIRKWNRVLLALTAACGVANALVSEPVVAVIPDYLFLTFFAVALYYQERLAFFDVVVKRGAYFLIGFATLAVAVDWRRALLLSPLWFAAPWIYDRVARAIDRMWLGRAYAPAEAERQFIADAQAAAGERDLAERAAESLGRIFRTRATVKFTEAGPEIALEDRADGVPFLSDDRRLLQSLTRTLGVVAENVRFREREEELRRLAGRAELKALRAQINPHFLFNALNAIAGLVHEQPALAEETVERLAEVFRYTLRKSEKEWARLDEEMEFVAAYLGVEQARFGERLRVETEIEPAARSVEVPAMSIQPLVENAIKHGVSAVERRGIVRIRARLRDGALLVEVEDNGPGFANGAGEGHGLRNISERLAGYYGGAARLGWENLEEGARVWVEIPEGAAYARAHR